MRILPANHRITAIAVLFAIVSLLLLRIFAPDRLLRLFNSLGMLWGWLELAILQHLGILGAGLIIVIVTWVLYLMVKAVAPDELQKAFALLWGFWCWTYIIRWKLGMASRHKIFSGILGLLLGASFYVVVEVTLVSLRILFSETVPYIPHLHAPGWLEILLLILSFVMVRHHWREWRLRHLNADMPEVVEKLLRELDQSRVPGTNTWSVESREAFIEKLMDKMQTVLERDRNRRIAFSIMEEVHLGDLAVVFFHPPHGGAHNEGNFRLGVKEGGAGAAFTRKNSIYVPSTKHLMAIDVEKNETIGQIYVPDPPKCPYHCVFCVPIISNTGEVTVLNISCDQVSAFDVFEFSVGRLMAAMIAMLG